MKPLVGISSVYRKPLPESVWDRFHENFVNEAYVNQLSKSGAVPIILPNLEKSEIEEQIFHLDAVLVPGGIDFNPKTYGEERKDGTDEPEDFMDSYQLELIKTARKMGKWVFGICRGFQAVNIAFGGKIYQDISSERKNSLVHMRKDSPYAPVHGVNLERGSLLYDFFGTEKIQVNSLHHQGVKIPGKNLKVTAIAEDGLAEGVEGDKILAVQWHPEALETPFFDRLVSLLV